MEGAYQRVTSVARNQYTLGYTTVAAVAGNCREIEVRVKRPDCRLYLNHGTVRFHLPPRKGNQAGNSWLVGRAKRSLAARAIRLR